MSKPVVVWQRNNLRIVAVDDVIDDAAEAVPHLIAEERFKDALGVDCWLEVRFADDEVIVADRFMLEIVSRNELMPAWVREFVAEQLAEYDEELGEEDSAS